MAQSSLLLSPELSSSLFLGRTASLQRGLDGKTQLQLLPGMLSPLPVICAVVSTPSLTCRNVAPSLEAFPGKRSRLNPILFYVADGLLVTRFTRWLFFPLLAFQAHTVKTTSGGAEPQVPSPLLYRPCLPTFQAPASS